MGILAGCTSAASVLVIGCSGDDNANNDGGPDGNADSSMMDTGRADVVDSGPDVLSMDVSSMDVDAGSCPVCKFRTDLAMAFCTRFQTCCNNSDAGPFDLNKCLQTAALSAWNGSNAELNNSEVLYGPNVTLDMTAAQSCLAGLQTLSCPTITSMEINTVTDNCYKAVVGKLANGGPCISSIECQPGKYCKFEGVDAGKSDGGQPLGQCADLIANGQKCGQAPPYGDPVYAHAECAYKGWHSPPSRCDYDSYPDQTGYVCAPLRTNGSVCFGDNECASGLCGNANQDCINTTCTCLTSRNYTPLCNALKIMDAGPG
jgi:hypothetical protein